MNIQELKVMQKDLKVQQLLKHVLAIKNYTDDALLYIPDDDIVNEFQLTGLFNQSNKHNEKRNNFSYNSVFLLNFTTGENITSPKINNDNILAK